MPFLEVITRCYKRPVMLAANQASLQEQSCHDWIQTLLVDEIGCGVGWANGNLAAYAPKLVGDYIWILDDDDVCIRDTFAAELKSIVDQYKPDVVFVKMDHAELGVLPDAESWGLQPEGARIGTSAFVVKREVWQAHAGAWRSAHYASDFDFIAAVWASKPTVYWYDVIASRVQRISRGAAE